MFFLCLRCLRCYAFTFGLIVCQVVLLKTWKTENLFKEYITATWLFKFKPFCTFPTQQNYWENPIASSCTHAGHYCHGVSYFSASSAVNILLPFIAKTLWLFEFQISLSPDSSTLYIKCGCWCNFIASTVFLKSLKKLSFQPHYGSGVDSASNRN
jgi:hypothetical protein